MKRKYIFLLAFMMLQFSLWECNSQDIHFSQFYFAPQVLNPANTGNFDGNWRANLNFRRQWGVIAPYHTFALAGDKQFYVRERNFSGGFLIEHDRSGSSSLVANKIYLAGAYHHYLGEKNKISIGLQTGFVNKHLNPDKLVFPDQYDADQGYFSPDVATGELGMQDNSNYLDINTGVSFTGDYGILRPQLGVGLFHVNMPKETFLGQDSKLPMRMVGHIGTDIVLFYDKFYLTPNVLYMEHNVAKEIVMGNTFTYVLSNNFMENSVFAGFYTRNEFTNFDAFIILLGFNYQQWRFGLSYDLNMSDLSNAASNPGGLEFSIVFREISTQIKKFYIPCERF